MFKYLFINIQGVFLNRDSKLNFASYLLIFSTHLIRSIRICSLTQELQAALLVAHLSGCY